MAPLDMHPASGFKGPGRAYRFISAALDALGAWNDSRLTRGALFRLSRHELDDLGLLPGDIDDIAASRRERRAAGHSVRAPKFPQAGPRGTG